MPSYGRLTVDGGGRTNLRKAKQMCIIKLIYSGPDPAESARKYGEFVHGFSNTLGAPTTTDKQDKAKQFDDTASAQRWAKSYLTSRNWEVVQIRTDPRSHN